LLASLWGDIPVGTNSIFDNARCWNTSSAAIKWPMCMGLNDPPNMPIFIKFTRQLYPAAVHGKPAKIKAKAALYKRM
jgi:hypothetical protein